MKANENYARLHGLSALDLACTVRATVICVFAICGREELYEERKRSFQRAFALNKRNLYFGHLSFAFDGVS